MLVQLQLYTLAELEKRHGPLRHIEGPFGGSYLRLVGADETLTYDFAYNALGEFINAIKISGQYFTKGYEIPKVFIQSVKSINLPGVPKGEELCFKLLGHILNMCRIDDEPLDGDEVEDLSAYLKAVMNRNEGNITEKEFRDKADKYYRDYKTSIFFGTQKGETDEG